MRKKILLLAIMVLGIAATPRAQDVALKTNFLYWASATPNLGIEASIADKPSLQLFYGWNPWKYSETKSTRHWLLMPEYRYWFCQAFNGWFVGAHLMGGEFNVSGIDVPLGVWDGLKDHRYEGWFLGGGITAGYQWVLSKHWNFEASIGVGYDYIKYKTFKCGNCGEKLNSSHKHYVGPTKAALSLIYTL